MHIATKHQTLRGQGIKDGDILTSKQKIILRAAYEDYSKKIFTLANASHSKFVI